jgi:hypothetical protein
MKMTNAARYRKRLLPFVCLLVLLTVWTGLGVADDIRNDGSFEMTTTGDCNVVIKMTPPMLIYQKLRESVSNLYLVMRNFASNRADTETVDKKADWDDSNHALTFSMKILGAGRNMGNHWEVDVPKEMEFYNLDESKRTLYFNQTLSSDDLAMRGMARLILPVGVHAMQWDASRHVASYVLPVPKGPERAGLLWIVAACLVGLGVVLTALSLFLKFPARKA